MINDWHKAPLATLEKASGRKARTLACHYAKENPALRGYVRIPDARPRGPMGSQGYHFYLVAGGRARAASAIQCDPLDFAGQYDMTELLAWERKTEAELDELQAARGKTA